MEIELDHKRLLWSEFPHVKRCAKRVLEDAATSLAQRELPYSAALQRAMDLYDSERSYRAAERDPLALALDALGPSPPFRCAVSAALFSANCDIASLLVSHDPLVKATEEFLRTTVETRARCDRTSCTFAAVLAAYMDFARCHKLRANVSGSKCPLGLQPLKARVNGSDETHFFPSAASWAAFVANKSLWQRLRGAPLNLAASTPDKAHESKKNESFKSHDVWMQAFRRKNALGNTFSKPQPRSKDQDELPVFVLACDVVDAIRKKAPDL